MPLIEQPSYWECDRCGLAVGMVTNEVDEEDEDPGVPAGWLRLDIRRVITNPEIVTYHQALHEAVEQAAAVMAGDQPVTDDHRQIARSLVALDAPSPNVVDEGSFALCHSCAPYLAMLGIEEYGVAGVEEEPEERTEPEVIRE